MSTTDPTGDRGGGGGGGGLASITPTDDNVTPVTSSTGVAVSPASHHQQHPPPSPLSGCYLLVVLPEPHTAQHKDLILNRLAKGFLSWDKDSCHVDLEKELQALVAQAPEGEEARNGERLIQYATENLVTEVLIHPQTNTLLQCMRNLLASFTKHRHIIHAGYTFSGNGSWILQDGTFSLADFLDAFSEHEVQRVLRAYENSVTVDINCAGVGEWSTSRLSKEACTRSCRVRLNPDDVLTAGVPAITSFTSYVGQYLVSQTLDQLMEPSDVVGNIRFSHPTLYVFPGGQGDAALFGINGFNMLVDGGFARKACFWDFARHLDRLDAVLMTRINNSNVGGMSSVLRKKREMHVYPQIGHFFCNLIERKNLNSPDGDKDLDPLILNLTDIGHEMMVDLRHINLRAHPCYRDPNPINLYHKVGHGTLDMYVLSPSKDSREVREFLSKWHASDSKLFSGSYRKDSNNLTFPIQNLASICALLVWQPANPEDTITRILFPGSTPQHKIFEGIDRLKHLEFLKHPVCTAKSISPSTSLLTLKDKPATKQKLGLIEEAKKTSDAKKEKKDLLDGKLSKAGEDIVSKPTPQGTPVNQPPKVQPPKIDVKTKKVIENKKIETESKKIEKDLKEHKKEPAIKKDTTRAEKDSDGKKVEGYKIKMDNEKAALAKESRPKPEPKKKETKEPKPVKIGRTESMAKSAVRLADKKQKTPVDKKETMKASPTTPKKSMNGAATKVELSKATTPRPISKPSAKTLSSTMPAKSAKDANNRKVVEQKNIEIASAENAAAPASTKAPPKQKVAERKPIGRRPKPISPIKARLPISPTKSTRSTPTTSVKSDKDGIIRKIKGDRGTADSSTVSTPSGIEIDSMTKLADKCLTEKSEDMSLDSIESKVLADLKEEREVVEEIEAVLQKAERIEGARRDDHLEGDDDITAEATDKKEDDMTEDDVTADIEEMPKKESSRKTSHELTEEDEYLIIEKEEIYIEDSVQSGEVEEKHAAGPVDAQVATPRIDEVPTKEEEDEEEAEEEEEEQEEAEVSEEKEKADVPEKQLGLAEEKLQETEEPEKLASSDEVLDEQMKNIIASTAEMVQKTEDKDDSGKKDSEDITKEPSSLSPDKFDSSEKKTTDTDVKPETDQKDRPVPEKLEESHERMSTLESGATTTAPTLPEDERIPLDEIKEVIDEKGLAEQETKPDGGVKVPEPLAAQVPPETKQDAKPFDVRPALHGIQREIVKTPDEVADLPVHEEVDPNLYRMEHFDKGKEEKPTQAAPPQKEVKEPEVPVVKEQKGVFSFFGKVADKFEKGMDKLTGKSRRDSEKDIDEKSSSKSGSPKEVKVQSIVSPGEAAAEDVTAGLVKVAETPELLENFEKGTPDITQVKVAAIKDTATFLAEEIEDLKKTSALPKEPIDTKDEVSAKELESEAQQPLEPVFETCVLTHAKDKLDRVTSELEGEEDVEEVEALLAEASKKFQDVKDSLHDSLESLEEKIAEEEMVRAGLPVATQDLVKDTLSEVVEKLEDIKPKDLDELPEKKGLEEGEAELEGDEGLDDEKDEAVVTKDLKGAVRDVGGVLAGSAGILIAEKPKDVIEIVKKVAEVLKKDDFLSPDVLFDSKATEGSEDDKAPEILSTEAVITPKKAGATEELPSQEEPEKLRESRRESTVSLTAQKSDAVGELHEETAASKIQTPTPSPTKDTEKEKIEAMKVCAELLEDEPVSSRPKRSVIEDPAKKDVVEAGIEAICVKQTVEKPKSIEGESITFDRKVSPVTAEVVIVTPDLSPTSPMLPSDKMHTEDAQAKPEVSDVTQQLPSDILSALQNEGSLEKVIEELVFTKKIKITREIIQHIIIIRRISRYEVIRVIEEIIIKRGSLPEDVITDMDLLTEDLVSREKREEIEDYINEEYVKNNKKITMKIIEDICIRKGVTKRVLNTIIILIVIKRKIPRETLLDLSDKEYLQLDLDESAAEEQDRASETSEISGFEDGERPPSADKYAEVRNFIENELVLKGQKITPQLIDDVCVAKHIPRRVFIEIIEKILIERKIPRSSMVDISEKEMSELLASEKEDDGISQPEEDDEDADRSGSSTPDRGQEIASYISDEFIAKKKKITLQSFKDICARNDVSVQMLWNLIDNVIEKQKLPRAVVIDISENELTELLAVEEEAIVKEDARDMDMLQEESCNKSEIENSIIEEFVSTKRRITPYIFEDICLRYKASRRVIIEIIETIIVKKHLQRNSILDITDTELAELLAVVEAEDEEESEVGLKSPVKEEKREDDIDEDQLVDGFVNIPSKGDATVEDVLKKVSVELVAKESEKDVDDFEAVEQEYKIYGLSLTPDKELPLTAQPATGDKLEDEAEDIVHDHVSDVVEAEEKIVGSAPTVGPTTKSEEKSADLSDISETTDAMEKYLVEAKEKPEAAALKPESVSPTTTDIKPSDLLIGKKAQDVLDEVSVQDSGVKDATHEGLESEATLGQSAATSPKVVEVKTSPEIPDNDMKMATAAGKPSTTAQPATQVKSDKVESEDESKIIEPEIDVSVAKRDSHGVVEPKMDSSTVVDTEDVASPPGSVSPKDEKSSRDISMNEDTPLSSSTVHRMVVTASSEDGGHEMEVCPTGSITFTPEDSLKSSPIKTTPDQDSLRLEKESIHSGISTPERDSMSDKSAIGTKDGDKITPEDSLDKSPSVTRDSQDLEDSLDKSDLVKLKETKAAERLSEEREEAAIDQIADAPKTIDKESLDLKIADKIIPTSLGSIEVSAPETGMKGAIAEKDDVTDTVSGTEATGEQVESTKVSSEAPIKKADIPETPSSLASEIQSATEHEIATRLSDSSVIIDKKDVGESIVPTKTPSPSRDQDYGSEEIHDRPKRSSVFDETVSAGDHDLDHMDTRIEAKHEEESDIKSPTKVPSTATIHESKDEKVQSVVPSHDISPSGADRSRSTSVSSDTKHIVDDHEGQKILDPSDTAKSPELGKTEDKTTIQAEDLHVTKPADKISPTTVDIKLDAEKEPLQHVTSPSIDSTKHSPVDLKESTDKADRSPSLVGDESESAKGLTDKDQQVTTESVDKGQTDTSTKSPTDDSVSTDIIDEKQKEGESIGRSRSSSIAVETHDEKEKISHPRLSIAEGGDHDHLELVDHSKTPSVTSEIQDEIEVVEDFKSSSMVTEKSDEKGQKVPEETVDRSKSSSPVDEKEFTDRAGSTGITPAVQERKPSVDQARPDSVAVEKEEVKGASDGSKMAIAMDDKEDDKESIGSSKAPSVAGEKDDEKEHMDRSRSASIAVEKQDEKESIDRSRSPSVVTEKQDEKGTADRSKSPSVASEKGDEKEPIDRSRSPSVVAEKLDVKDASDRSRSPSISTGKTDEKETVDRSKSPSVASEKEDEKESIDRSRSPSVATGKQDEKETIARSKSPSVASEKGDEKEPVDRSRSPSIVAEKHDVKEAIDRSKSPSVASEKSEEKESIDRSRSPSVVADKPDVKDAVDRSKSPSVASEKGDEKELVDRAKSPSVASDKGGEKESIDRSRSPSIVADKHDAKDAIDRSKSPSIASEKGDEKESVDHSKSPSVASEKGDEKESIDRSRSPSVATGKQDEKETIDGSKSASAPIEKEDEKESIDRSRSPSIMTDKLDVKDVSDRSRSASVETDKIPEKETIDRSKSPSVTSEKEDEKKSIDRSRSPSVATGKQDEKETIDGSKSPSVPSEKGDEKESIDRSRSPSVVAEKHDIKDSMDRSKSPSVASEKGDEKDSIDRSRSSSVAAETRDEKETIDRSKSPSIASEKGDEKEPIDSAISPSSVTEKQDGKDSIDRSKSPSVASEKGDEKESIAHSRSPSIATGKPDEKETIDRSKSPSIASEKGDEKELIDSARSPSLVTEKQDGKDSIDRSKSPSVASEKGDEKELIDRSRSPSVATEKQDEKETIDRSKSPSVASEIGDGKETIDRSRSPSVVAEKQDEKETIDRSKSPSVASEKGDGKETIDRSRSPSVVAEKQDEKETIDRSKSPSVASEKGDGKELIDRSRSPSVAIEKQDEKETIDRSKSPSVASEKGDGKETIDRSRSPSVVAEKLDVKDASDRSRSPSVASEKADERETIDRSRSSSVVAEKLDVKDASDRSRSPSVTIGRLEEKETTDPSKSPSGASEKGDEKETVARSKSPSVASEKGDEKDTTARSKSPSVASERGDEKETVPRSKSPSVASEKGDEKDTTARERGDEKETVPRSKSPSVASEKGDEKDTTARSKSPSVASEKGDEKETVPRSKSPSVASEKGDEKDTTARSKSPSVASEKGDEKETVARSKSPSVASEKGDEKDTTARSKSPSVASEKGDEKETVARSKSPSVASEKPDEKDTIARSKSPSEASEKGDEKETIDRSRSPSIVAEKHDVKEAIDRSKSPSVASEKSEEKESIDRSRSPSVVADKPDVKDAVDRSKSPSVASEKGDEKELVDRAKSPSVASEKGGEKESIDRSRSPSIVADKHDVKDAIDRSKSPSVASEKGDEKESIDRSKSPSVASEKGDEKETIDRSRSPSVATDKPDVKDAIDRSKSPSVASEKGHEKESTDRSKSPSVASEKEGERELIDRSRSPSVVTKKQDEKEDEKEQVTRSRSTSLTPERQEEKESSDRSKSPSVASEKDDGKELIDRSRSASLAPETQDGKESTDRSRSPSVVTEKLDEKASIDRSKSPSVASEKESIARSRSASIASEKQDDKESTDHSKPPSVAGEKEDEKVSIDRSRSASIAVEKEDAKDSIDRSRSPSVVTEKQDEKETTDRSKSPSVASDKGDEKASIDRSRSASVVTEKPDDKESVDHPKSPSVTSEKELIDRSRSSSIAGEKQPETGVLDRSRSPSLVEEKPSEKELASRSRSSSATIEKSDEKESRDEPETHDEKASITGSKSPGTSPVKEDAKESLDHSRSSSIAGEKEPVDLSKPASIAAEKAEEQSKPPSTGVEKHDGMESIDGSKSPSVAGEKQDVKELSDHVVSPTTSEGKQDVTETVDRSKSPSVAGDKQDGDEPDRSRSSSIAGEKQSVDRSRSASIMSEKPDAKEPLDGSKSPSAADGKHDGTESSDRSRSGSIAVEPHEAKESIDRSRTSSIADERLDDKELIGRSRSASIAVGKLDEKETIARSRSASIAVGQQEKELIDRSRSSSVVAEKQEEEETVDRSRSDSIIVEKPEHKEPVDRSRSGSVVAEKQEEKDMVDRSRSGSVVAEKQEEKDTRSRSGSVIAEKQEAEEESVDRSRSSSIVAEKQTEQFERSRLPSIASEKTAQKASADGSRSASISPQDRIEKVLADVSESSITVEGTQKDGSTVHSRSPSITGEKRDAEQVVDHSRSPSILSDNQDKIDLSVRSESPKTVDADHEEKDSPDSSKAADIKKPTDVIESHVMTTQHPAEAIDDKLPKGSTRLEKDAADEPIDLSSTASTGAELSSHDAGKRASIVDAHPVDKKSLDASKESAPTGTTVQDSKLDESDAVQAMQKLAETIADKSLACDIKDGGALHDVETVETVEHEIAHDKSRSSSLFDAGEKTPKSRSPTASLIDDEVPEVSKPSDQATITKEDVSRKSSMAEISHDILDQLPSDSKKFCTMELEGALPERGSVEIAQDIAGRFAKDYHTTSEEIAKIEEYIVNKYIAKKERISPQIVDEIVTLYSISKHIILELIEAIIIEKNVPRDVIVSFPKDDETKVSDIVSEDDHVDVIDIPPAKQLEIETRIHQEFVTKNKKITSLFINELAAMTFISRHIIIMIIQKMVRDQKGLTADQLESGILDESMTKTVQSGTTHEQSSESVKSHESSVPDDGHSGSHPPSDTDHMSHSDKVSEDAPMISDSKRMEIETYVMEECVKKRIKINLLVFEQIIMRMGVPRSALLSVIEKIILSGKVPRAEMIDDAIYDEVERASSDRLSESEDKGSKEYMSSRDRLMELSGKSTPDPKSSGYSTPEVRHYDDKYGKGMVSYSNDYESPFHKAFVGGMTEIRTTHITTLSGKSTPDYSVRGETPESLSESVSQTKLEEKFGLDTVTSSEKTSTSVHKTDVTSTTGTTTTTTVDLVTEPAKPTTKLAPSKEDPHAESDEDEQVVIKKVITTEIIEETRPVTEITIHKQEIVEQPPVMITKTIESSSSDKHDDYEVHTISRTVQETGSPETIEIVTVKTIETVVTEDMSPETIMSKLGSLDGTKDLSVTEHTEGDIKTVTTTVTMTTESDHEISPQKIVEKIVGESGSKAMDKVGDESYTTTQVISKVTYAAPIDSQQTDKVIAGHKEDTAATTATLTSGGQTKSDSDTSAADSAGLVEKSKSVSQTLSERIGLEKVEHPRSPVIKDLISDERSFTGRVSPDVPAGRESQQAGSASHSASDVPGSPMFRDSGIAFGQMSGRSTPDKRGASRSSTATPEGVRSNEVIRTTITTTRTMSDEGDIITTTMEITETTNEKGETIILAEKTDVKVEDRIISDDMSKSTLSSGFEALKAPADYTAEAEADQVSPRSDHSSVQSRAGTHIWGGSEERYTYSDDDVPGSPLSTTSQVGYSPQSTYPFDDHSSDKASSRKSMEFSVADMSASFYGELPDLPPRVTTIKTTHLDGSDSEAPGSSVPAESDFSFKKFTVAKELAGTVRDGQSDGKKFIDEADLDFEKALTEPKGTKTEKELSSVVGTSSSSSQSQVGDKKPEAKSDSKKDPLAGWGSPLGLPSPKPPRKFNLRTVARPNVLEESQDSINFDPIKDWGEPLRLPSPAPVVDEGSNKGAPSTPKKERKQPKKIISENIKNRKRSESPAKNEKKSKDAKAKIQPVYIDLTYVPHHGNSYYTSVEFFKRVRARYYVFSGTEPSREVYDALLDAKKTWEDKDLEVTMIPTYDTDTLGYWVADNEEALAANHIDLSPSASRCTINLQDHETSCSAYRLEF